MLIFALLIGLYSYSILFLGLSHLLTIGPVFLNSLAWSIVAFYIVKKQNKKPFLKSWFHNLSRNNKSGIALLFLLILVNLVGALGPELAFDALWYHLTIPKIFIQQNSIYFIHDNLFYYSLMPKLTEMLYVSALVLSNEITAKIIHLVFGLLTCIVLFRISRLYLSKNYSYLVVLLFYSNLVVMWLSITAFTDLSRSFYETIALLYFLYYLKNRKYKKLLISAALLGFAVSTKVLAIGTIPIFIIAILICRKLTMGKRVKQAALFLTVSLVVPLPWFLLSFFYTKNPIYPLFTGLGLRNFSTDLLSPITFIKTFIGIFLYSPDPISPMYIIALPIAVVGIVRLNTKYGFLLLYSVYTYLVWYVSSQSGGARFLTAYLPAYSLLAILAIVGLRNKKITKIVIASVILVAITNVTYRAIANAKYVPVLIGAQSKQDFLMNNLNFGFGDFYDENSEVRKIVGEKKVLLLNVHNLYYVDFNYELAMPKDLKNITYILAQNTNLPQELIKAKVVYRNVRSNSTLYKL